MKGLSQNKQCSLYSSALCFFLLSIMRMNCPAQDIQNLDPPRDLECLVDKANLIDPERAQKIRSRGRRLLENTETPIFVVTIDKISDHVDEDISIDDFVERLFDQWQIGSSANEGNEETLSKGVLLLVSNESGEARIQLGAGWEQEKFEHCQRIYDSVITPRFKASKYSQGILEGFDALLRMIPKDIQNLDPPGPLECLVDKANLIHPEHAQKIRSRGRQLLENTETPIFVVTIDKISDHVDEDISIDDFGESLFKHWQIGSSANGGNEETLSKGVLLLVSNESGEAKIKLGAGWGREMEQHCEWVYDSVITPRFGASKYSRGIFAGFDALLRMDQIGMAIIEKDNPHNDVPSPRGSFRANHSPKEGFSPLFILAIVVGLYTLLSVWFYGSKGLAWRFWAKTFSLLTSFKK